MQITKYSDLSDDKLLEMALSNEPLGLLDSFYFDNEVDKRNLWNLALQRAKNLE